MGLKDILLVVGPAPRGELIDTAALLAAQHDAHLTALHVMPPPRPIMGEGSADLIEAQRRWAREAADEAGRTFNQRIEAAGLSARAEWRVQSGDPGAIASINARHADLVVIEQPGSPESEGWEVPGAEDLLFTGGRPLLVVPNTGRFQNPGGNVLVAWNASREAARAVHDALPLMKAAKQVTVLVINPAGIGRGAGGIPGADIALHLARHGLNAIAKQETTDQLDPADILLNYAADTGADLLVMGGYGHARWREIALGGMTRAIMTHMTLPVLLSH